MGQHGSMGEAAADILAPHLAVEADAGIDLPHDGGGALGIAPAPEIVARTRFGHGGVLSVQKVLQRRQALFAATLLAAMGLRQAAAAENGLSRLRTLPEPR